MQPERTLRLLYDIIRAAEKIERFASGKTLSQYLADELLRSGVERQFEIIGEALSQLAKAAPGVVEQIREHQRIIAFRNVLIHGYAIVDDRLVWDAVENHLPDLLIDARRLWPEGTATPAEPAV